MTKHTPTEAMKIDRLLDSVARPASRDRIIWTLPAIGARIGRGREFAAELAKAVDSPIKRQGRQFYVFEEDLLSYMRRGG